MKSVLVRIKQYLPDSTIAEQGVLNYILANPDKAVQHNIHQLSEYSYSSASTIVRLCRKLGFQGYRDLQNSLLSELVVQKQDRQQRFQHMDPHDQLTEIVDKITAKNISSLENYQKMLLWFSFS